MKKTFYLDFLFFFCTIFSIQVLSQITLWKEIGNYNHSVIDPESNIYASTDLSVFKSNDLGNTWQEIYTSSFPCIYGSYLQIWIDTDYTNVNRIIIAQFTGEPCTHAPVMISNNDGTTWNEFNAPQNYAGFAFLSNGNILAIADSNIYRTTDEGNSWTTLENLPEMNYPWVRDHIVVDEYDHLFIGIEYSQYIPDPYYENWYYEKIYRSTNVGINWEELITSYISRYSYSFSWSTSLTGDIFFGDDWANKTYRYNPERIYLPYNVYMGSAINIDSIRLIYCSNGSTKFSSDNGYTWNDVTQGHSFYRMVGVDSLGYVYCEEINKIFKSNYTWFQMFNKNIIDFGSIPVQDTSYNTIFFKNRFSFNIELDSLKCYGGNFFINDVSSSSVAAGDSIGIQIGIFPDSFTYFNGLLEVYSPYINASINITAQSPYPVLSPLTTQINFLPWTYIDSTSMYYFKYYNNSAANNLVIDSVFLLNGEPFCMSPITFPIILVPYDTSQIELSFSPHFQGTFQDSLIILSNTEVGENYIMVRGRGRNLTGIATNTEISFGNALTQNYPNPFNPTTSIQYSLANSRLVTLKVFDVLGNEVATLVNEEKPAGSYNVEFNGSLFPSGVYFYKLQSGNFLQVRKMLLLK